MNAPTIFLSAATDDLESLRNVLHGAFSRARCRVFTQNRSLGAAPGTLRDFLVEHIDLSDCVIHLAGVAYGADADEPFPDAPDFQCSWTQFEYYYAHQQGKKVIGLICAPVLCRKDFVESGADADDIALKRRLQGEHRQRVTSGKFIGTPLADKVKRTLNEKVNSLEELLQIIAASVASVHGLTGILSFEPKLHQLPLRPLGFVGRESDLTKLRAMNPASGTVLTGLRGMGGIGKTALALVVAHEWAPRYPDAQLFLDARGTQPNPPSAGDLLAQVIQMFDAEFKRGDDDSQLGPKYQSVLHGKKVLILLDNARDAAQAAPLIPSGDCAFIVTSRNNFMLGNRPAYSVNKLPDAEATALLRERYSALADTDAVSLVKLCAGLPLALRIAGAHLALDANERGGVADVAGYLKKLRAGRLGALDADAPDAGEITISETLRLSEAQLSEVERDAWRKLGVFTASFDERAAKEIAGAEEAMLSLFVRRSLLEREGADRYKLHDLAADYAREQLSEHALNDLHLSHARHFTEIGKEAETLCTTKGKHLEGLALFDRERVQIEAAYDWLVKRDDDVAAQHLIALVRAMVYTGQVLRFHPRQSIDWLEKQLRSAQTLKDRESEGNALCNLGFAHHSLSNDRKAIQSYEGALTIARETGNRRSECATLVGLGNVREALGDFPEAIKNRELALVIAREIGHRRLESDSLGALGCAHFSAGDARKAIEFHEQAIVICREIGDRRGEAQDLGNLGAAYQLLGDYAKVITFAEQALALAREIKDVRIEGVFLHNLAEAQIVLGDLGKAGEFSRLALAIAVEFGYRLLEGNVIWLQAQAAEKQSDLRQAIAHADHALQIYEAIEAPEAAKVRTKLAEWHGQA